MRRLVRDPATDLFARPPHGTGQTVLREALVLADHNAYHLGQLVLIRRLLGPGRPSSVKPSVTPPDAGPGRIRTLERGDIPQLVVLSQQAFQRRERVGADAM